MPSGALGAFAALCCRLDWFGDQRLLASCGRQQWTEMPTAYRPTVLGGASRLFWQGGAAAAVMVAGSPNVTAVYEVGTRAQQVLETVSSALSRAPGLRVCVRASVCRVGSARG